MRSDEIKKGFHRAPHRALLKATGVTDAEGVPRLMELELIEPAVFLPLAPPDQTDRLLAAVMARLDAD